MNSLIINKKIRLAVIGGIAALLVLLLIGSWWHRRCINSRHFNNRLLFKAFYFEDAESTAALQELQSARLVRHLSKGQQELLHLKKASNLVKNNDLQGALSELRLVLENSKVAELQTLALVRSVRLLVELKQSAEGTKLLKQYRDWLPTITALELQGDLFYVEGNLKDARSSYLKAWQYSSVEETYRRLLLKILGC